MSEEEREGERIMLSVNIINIHAQQGRKLALRRRKSYFYV